MFNLISECTTCGSDRFEYIGKYKNSNNGRWVCEFECVCGFKNILCGYESE